VIGKLGQLVLHYYSTVARSQGEMRLYMYVIRLRILCHFHSVVDFMYLHTSAVFETVLYEE
jgi:hypothetical protein